MQFSQFFTFAFALAALPLPAKLPKTAKLSIAKQEFSLSEFQSACDGAVLGYKQFLESSALSAPHAAELVENAQKTMKEILANIEFRELEKVSQEDVAVAMELFAEKASRSFDELAVKVAAGDVKLQADWQEARVKVSAALSGMKLNVFGKLNLVKKVPATFYPQKIPRWANAVILSFFGAQTALVVGITGGIFAPQYREANSNAVSLLSTNDTAYYNMNITIGRESAIATVWPRVKTLFPVGKITPKNNYINFSWLSSPWSNATFTTFTIDPQNIKCEGFRHVYWLNPNLKFIYYCRTRTFARKIRN